jgi:hypothetical protein
MSWTGAHYSDDSRAALLVLGPGHCRRCRYKARLQFDFATFRDHTCTRCGMKFPASEIDGLNKSEDAMSHSKRPHPHEPAPDQAGPTIHLSHDDAASLWTATILPGDHSGQGITLPRALRALAKVLEDAEGVPEPAPA